MSSSSAKPNQAKKTRYRPGPHKKFAKGTGGYGPVDDKLTLRLPHQMKANLGKMAAKKNKSIEHYLRTSALEALQRDEDILKKAGGTPPKCIDFFRDLRQLERLI